MNAEKLAKLQSQVRIGGKGSPRRKVKKVTKTNNDQNDSKLQTYLQKTGVGAYESYDQINMFQEDGNVIHFANPKVGNLSKINARNIFGFSQEKEITELVPSILEQMGPDSMASLRKLAEAYQSAQNAGAADEDDDEIPELVENFDSADIEEKTEDATEKSEETAEKSEETKAEETPEKEEATA